MEFVAKGPVDNKSALVQVMAWRRTGNKPLPEPVLITDAYIGARGGDEFITKTHVRGFFDTDLHEVSWHFATHSA